MTEIFTALITGAFTLAAGFGGILAIGLRDSKRAKRDRRREAYLELMLALDQFNRIFSAPLTVDQRTRSGTVGQAVGDAANRVQIAYFSVFLVAPRNVQLKAGKAWQAAWAVHDRLKGKPDDNREPVDFVDELTTLTGDLATASMEFANAARTAEGESLPPPIPPAG